MNWSEYQKLIFLNVKNDLCHLVVTARAGSAKTTTIVESSKHIPRGKRALFCAFNKNIQEALKDKLPSYVETRTLHSIGFEACKKRFPAITLNQYKTTNID